MNFWNFSHIRIIKDKNKIKDIQLNAISKTYNFLSKKTFSKLNQLISKKLKLSATIHSTISLSHLAYISRKNPLKTIVIIGKILNDDRVLNVPNISVCALKIAFSAKKRILEAGGSFVTFGELAIQNPIAKNIFLVKSAKIKKYNQKYKK